MTLDTRDPLVKSMDAAAHRREIANAVAATIERCARIAEIAESNFPDTMRRDIAHAIRALKDKP